MACCNAAGGESPRRKREYMENGQVIKQSLTGMRDPHDPRYAPEWRSMLEKLPLPVRGL